MSPGVKEATKEAAKNANGLIHKRLLFVFTAKIQALKHNIPKNDKKKKKELAVIMVQMEADLDEKHKEELSQIEDNLVL